jgi:hypothetical protein
VALLVLLLVLLAEEPQVAYIYYIHLDMYSIYI